MGSGDPSGLQNRRELASLALVSSTLTRFRQPLYLELAKPVRGPYRTMLSRGQDAGGVIVSARKPGSQIATS